MSTPDPDPRPRYGEYATPEEQRARMQPHAGVEARPEVRVEPVHHAHPLTGPATTSAAQPSRRADRIATIVLLAYGLFTVVTAIPQLVDFPAFAETWMRMVGIDESFTNFDEGRRWGMIAAVAFAGGWLSTAFWSWRSLSHRRITWWIPLLGAIVSFVAASLCLTVPLLGDPAIANYFATHG